MTRALRWLALCIASFALAAPAMAHKPSDSYLTITQSTTAITGQWDIALRDLDFAIGLATDGNGEITWGEVRRHHADIAAYALARLAVEGDGQPCVVRAGEQQVDQHTDGAYTVIPLQVSCPSAPAQLRLTYRLFADLDPETRRWAMERCTPHPIAAMQAPVKLDRFWNETWNASVVWCKKSANPPIAHQRRTADRDDDPLTPEICSHYQSHLYVPCSLTLQARSGALLFPGRDGRPNRPTHSDRCCAGRCTPPRHARSSRPRPS